jgi:hypothetical protein
MKKNSQSVLTTKGKIGLYSVVLVWLDASMRTSISHFCDWAKSSDDAIQKAKDANREQYEGQLLTTSATMNITGLAKSGFRVNKKSK